VRRISGLSNRSKIISISFWESSPTPNKKRMTKVEKNYRDALIAYQRELMDKLYKDDEKLFKDLNKLIKK